MSEFDDLSTALDSLGTDLTSSLAEIKVVLDSSKQSLQPLIDKVAAQKAELDAFTAAEAPPPPPPAPPAA